MHYARRRQECDIYLAFRRRRQDGVELIIGIRRRGFQIFPKHKFTISTYMYKASIKFTT